MEATNADEFNFLLDRDQELVVVALGQFVRKLALQVLRGVVLKTPVDTGRARGNWQVTIGAPAESQLDTTDKAGGSTISKGLAELAQYHPFLSIWVSNNLPYIERLEDGYSSQAPGGMVALTIAEVETQLGAAA